MLGVAFTSNTFDDPPAVSFTLYELKNSSSGLCVNATLKSVPTQEPTTPVGNVLGISFGVSN